jgi:hypothetical protein
MVSHTLTSQIFSREHTGSSVKAAAPAHRPRSAFRRFLDAMKEARYRQVEHEVARYLERTGSKLTDSVERDIERRFLKP